MSHEPEQVQAGHETGRADAQPSALSRRGFLQSMAASGSVVVLGRPALAADSGYAEGVVFHDRDGSGERASDDPGVAGVRVSNGRQVTVTDDDGRWRLPLDGERTVFFVIKPSGWRTPLTRDNLPRFHHVHDPQGSPELRYSGIESSGPLPDSIDFPLYPQDEPGEFRVLMCGDPQPRNGREVGYIAQSAVPQLAQEQAAFGVSLGDIMFDDLDLFEPLNQALSHVGLPWYNVLGNHDLNFDVPDNTHANDTFLRVYGPSYYAFEYGPVHFLLLNNVVWNGQDPENPNRTSNYVGKIGERQLEFVREELKHVPKDKLTVILLHIPLWSPDSESERGNTADREAFYQLLKDRPNTVSLCAHRHWHGHFFHGPEQGWEGEQPHHHVIMGTICGSWFRGLPNERGVPHAVMPDGTPRGYGVFRFSGNTYTIEGYKVFGNRDEAMHIDLPNIVSREQAHETTLSVNVYDGSERSTVRFRVDRDGEWHDLEQVLTEDPRYVRIHEREQEAEMPGPYLPMSRPRNCYHLWQGKLPADLAEGSHLVEVETTDMFGNVFRRSRPVRITA